MRKRWQRLILGALCIWLLPLDAHAADLLIPGGQVIGLQLRQDTVTVAAFDDSLGTNAKEAGLKIGDEIEWIDDYRIQCAQDVLEALEHSDGAVEIRVNRAGNIRELKMNPRITGQGPRLGVYLRDGITGIGTVSWYDPEDGSFGALGHGVNDAGGNLVDMTVGECYQAAIVEVRKGKSGEPGQLRGAVEAGQALGPLDRNTEQGVFGKCETGWPGEALPVGAPEDVQTGEAIIRSTVAGNQTREYSVEILKIYPNSGNKGRNFLLRVTDPALLETTGGIVQGMSGSPIIQDGKLVGAVTHVLVNDPTTGYGIFIENMLDAAA